MKWLKFIFEGSFLDQLSETECQNWNFHFLYYNGSTDPHGGCCISTGEEVSEATVTSDVLVKGSLRALVNLIEQLEGEAWTEREIGKVPQHIITSDRNIHTIESRL
jgi:hypothetical protein